MIPENLHFIGTGGAGMAPLAFLLHQRGHKISGSDSTATANTERLSQMGIAVHIGHAADNVPDSCSMIVFSSAIQPDNPEIQRGIALGLPAVRRGEMLAMVSRNYRRCAAVSGSHGKSSITALLSHIMVHTGMNPGYMVGAKVYGATDFAAGKDDDIFITEADESDGTHTLLNPYLGIIPNFDSDHAWSVGGEAQLTANFRRFAGNSGKLLCGDTPECRKLFSDHPDVEFISLPDKFANFFGFQAANAAIAVRAAEILGADRSEAIASLASFSGVARRMHIVSETPQRIVVEDYAHHPFEVKASVALLRQMFPDRHLRLVFQPHRYARLAKYFDEFAAELAKADSVIVTDVFAAWCESGSRGGRELADAIPGAVFSPGNFADTAALASSDLPPGGVIAVLGAGTVDQVLNYL